jgi:putative tryptophan/tyrosine transport system substrate-binding protein
MKELGWEEGRNIRFEFVWAGGRTEDVPALARDLVARTARNADEVGRALDGITAADVGAVNVLASPMLNGTRRLIIDRLRNNRLPSIYEWPESADDGGLLGYGAPITSLYRRVAVLVDKILRGARPADLPIEQPTKLELVVNLRTANAIGLTIPPSLLLRADRVIE